MVFLLQADVNIPIVTTRSFSLPCYLQGSENGRVVTIGKHSRLNRQTLIYPPELEVKETTDTASSASFLDLYFEFDDSGQISTKIYDKRDDFNFKIINFPNMSSNIPASPAYGAYISQLIRYARASSNYSDFLKRHLHLRNRLLDQGYEKIRLIRSLKKCIFRYQDLVEIYSVSAEKIINDGFAYSENV